jgi:predicted nucleic acid-binding protein
MPYLLDTNCWMQVVRDREHAREVADLLAAVPPSEIRLTDFALNGVGLAMRRHRMLDRFPTFVAESGIGRIVMVVRLAPEELRHVADACRTHGLDYDDAYQYAAAELHGLRLVSLDADFDRTPTGRLTPAAALQAFKDEQARRQEPQP